MKAQPKERIDANKVKNRYLFRFLFFYIMLSGMLSYRATAGLVAQPKFLFLDAKHRSAPLYLANPGTEEVEAWVDVKYGYVASDDSGRPTVIMDSLPSASEQSCAGWTEVYPKRFILGPKEGQTVRIVCHPPAGLADGEYWARILVTSRPRKLQRAPSDTAVTAAKSGLVIISQVGLPFHFRVGKVDNGVAVTDFKAAQEGKSLAFKCTLVRTGNASYWGSRTATLIGNDGRVVASVTKNAVVYKTYSVLDTIGIGNVAPGAYTLELELVTGKRTDIVPTDLLRSPAMKTSIPVELR